MRTQGISLDQPSRDECSFSSDICKNNHEISLEKNANELAGYKNAVCEMFNSFIALKTGINRYVKYTRHDSTKY